MDKITKYGSIIFGLFLIIGIGIPTQDVFGVPVNLSTWMAESYPSVSGFPDGVWVVSGDELSVTQIMNGQPTMFFSDFNAFNTNLVGTIQVLPGAGDDDFIGFAIGFEPGDSTDTNADYLLVDWKQGTQSADFADPDGTSGGTAFAGLAVSRVTGIPNADEFWQHIDDANNPNGGLEELARGTNLGNVGYVDATDFEFEFVFTADKLQVFVDGVLEIDIAGTFDDGRIAFYNFSQSQVMYSGFTVEPVEPVDPVVGGELLPIETTSLLLASAQSFSWMIPVILSVVGIGLFVVSRKSENS